MNKKRVLSIILILVICLHNLLFTSGLRLYAAARTYIVKATNVNIRSGPGTNYDILGRLTIGCRIESDGSSNDNTGKLWYRFNYNGKTAYIREDFLKAANATSYTYDANFEAELSAQGFPEDYKVLLRDIHSEYPNWKFEMQRINMDFNTAIAGEMEGTRTLVNSSSISSYKSVDLGKYDYTKSKWPSFDGAGWVAASRDITAYYLDPRNFLYYPYIFQFEEQTFNPNLHTLAGVTEMVKGTFLEAAINTDNIFGNVDMSIFQNYTDNQVVVPIIPNIVDGNSTNHSNNYPNITSNIGPGESTANTNQGNVWGAGIQTEENLGPGISNPDIPVVPILGINNEVYAFSGVMFSPSVGNSVGTVPSPFGNSINYNSSGYSSNSYSSDDVSFNFQFLPSGTHTYAEIIYDACRQVGINPYVVVSMILQEQGKDGKSDSISGKNSKYPGIYNFGNIGAYAADGLTPVENGLKYASNAGSYNRPWNSKEKSIYGTVDYYANSFIKKGQDTFYLKKWNVQGENVFKHQYMSNVAGANSEGQLLGSCYDDNLLSQTHIFKIPYYSNMPASPSPMPTTDGSPNNWLKSLSVTGHVLTPTFDTNVNEYTLVVDQNVSSIKVNAEPYDNRAKIAGTGNVNLTVSNTIVEVNVVAENQSVRQYKIVIYKTGVQDIVSQNANVVVPIIFDLNNNTQANTGMPNIINPSGSLPNVVAPNLSPQGNSNTSNIIIPNINNNLTTGRGPGE